MGEDAEDPVEAAQRLEAALERIGKAIERQPRAQASQAPDDAEQDLHAQSEEGSAGQPLESPGLEWLTARLDTVIAELRGVLGVSPAQAPTELGPNEQG